MLSCRPIIESITDYLEGRLGPLRRAGFLIHIRTCWQCRQYLEQIKTVIAAATQLPLDQAPARIVESVLIRTRAARSARL
jgi:hypothetical protein